jgi:hypothetical protein
VASLPPIAAPARATTPAPVAPAAALPSASLLGTSRPTLAPPVPFGSANAATLSGAQGVPR